MSNVMEFDPRSLYRLGTRIKTRYEPSYVFLTFSPERGFKMTEDPDIEKIESIRNMLDEFDNPPNQTELKTKIKEEMGYSDSQVLMLLRKGEDKYWNVMKGPKNSRVYISKNSVC